MLIVSGSDSTGLLIWDIQLKQIVFQVDPQTCGKDAILGVDTTSKEKYWAVVVEME